MPAITVEAEFTNSLTPPGLNLAKPWPFWADLAGGDDGRNSCDSTRWHTVAGQRTVHSQASPSGLCRL